MLAGTQRLNLEGQETCTQRLTLEGQGGQETGTQRLTLEGQERQLVEVKQGPVNPGLLKLCVTSIVSLYSFDLNNVLWEIFIQIKN
jgi:hypothetical protein